MRRKRRRRRRQEGTKIGPPHGFQVHHRSLVSQYMHIHLIHPRKEEEEDEAKKKKEEEYEEEEENKEEEDRHKDFKFTTAAFHSSTSIYPTLASSQRFLA